MFERVDTEGEREHEENQLMEMKMTQTRFVFFKYKDIGFVLGSVDDEEFKAQHAQTEKKKTRNNWDY